MAKGHLFEYFPENDAKTAGSKVHSKKNNKVLRKSIAFWFLVGGIFLFILLTINNLDIFLWGDESFRAMIGKSTSVKGYPTHWDDVRYVVGVDESKISKLFPGKYVEPSSWLQYYVIALSFKLFGVSILAARLPFWIVGLLIFFTLYRYRYLFPKPDATFSLVVVMLILNVTFLIYTLQVNYYIYALFFTLLSSCIFIDIIKNPGSISTKKLLFLIIINQLLLHNHIPTFVSVFFVQTIFLFFRVRKEKHSGKIKAIIFVVISGLLFLIGYRLYASIDVIKHGALFWTSIVVFVSQINFYVFPFIGFIFLLGVMYWYREKLLGKLWLLYIGLVTVVHIFLMSYFNYNGAMPFRYISSFMVLWFIAIACVLVSIPKRWPVIIIFFFVLIPNLYSGFSKIFTSVILPAPVTFMVYRDVPTIPFIANRDVRCFYCEYLDGLINTYPHPLENIVIELQKMNVENKKLYMGSCEGNTIMFYTKGIEIGQNPKKLYEKVYGKSFHVSDADVIVNNPFCSLTISHDEVLKLGYKEKVVPLSQKIFINDGELNVRGVFEYPFIPAAIIYTKIKN